MHKDIIIRMADLHDLPLLEKVGDNLFDHKIKKERAMEFFNDLRHHLFIACLPDQIIGMASGFHYVHPDKDPVLFINEVGVVKKYRNKGIGRNLVRQLCDHGKKLGCNEVWIATQASNQAARKSFVAAGGTEEKDAVVLINYTL